MGCCRSVYPAIAMVDAQERSVGGATREDNGVAVSVSTYPRCNAGGTATLWGRSLSGARWTDSVIRNTAIVARLKLPSSTPTYNHPERSYSLLSHPFSLS